MNIVIKRGDIVDEPVDVLVSTANPWLQMSGGVNGEILLRGGESIQKELEEYLKKRDIRCVPQGTVVMTGPGPLNVKCILHAVGVDAFYESSIPVMEKLIVDCLKIAELKGGGRVALPAIATGFGKLKVEDFATALKQATDYNFEQIEELVVVLSDDMHVSKVENVLAT